MSEKPGNWVEEPTGDIETGHWDLENFDRNAYKDPPTAEEEEELPAENEHG